MNTSFIQNQPMYTLIPAQCVNVIACVPVIQPQAMSLNNAAISLNNQNLFDSGNSSALNETQPREEPAFAPMGQMPNGVPIICQSGVVMQCVPQLGFTYMPPVEGAYSYPFIINPQYQYQFENYEREFCNCKPQEDCKQSSPEVKSQTSSPKQPETEIKVEINEELIINTDFRIPLQDKNIGVYTPHQRYQRIVKYKLKLKKRREKIPVCRVFPGRSLAAKIKLRKDGKFANSKCDDKEIKQNELCKGKGISENLENEDVIIIINDSE